MILPRILWIINDLVNYVISTDARILPVGRQGGEIFLIVTIDFSTPQAPLEMTMQKNFPHRQ